MSKGRNLTKRKWGDFRKSRKPSIDYKYPRRDIDKIDAPKLSMRCPHQWLFWRHWY